MSISKVNNKTGHNEMWKWYLNQIIFRFIFLYFAEPPVRTWYHFNSCCEFRFLLKSEKKTESKIRTNWICVWISSGHSNTIINWILAQPTVWTWTWTWTWNVHMNNNNKINVRADWFVTRLWRLNSNVCAMCVLCCIYPRNHLKNIHFFFCPCSLSNYWTKSHWSSKWRDTY